MKWIKELFKPKFLEWEEYQEKMNELEKKSWDEDLRKQSKEINFTS